MKNVVEPSVSGTAAARGCWAVQIAARDGQLSASAGVCFGYLIHVPWWSTPAVDISVTRRRRLPPPGLSSPFLEGYRKCQKKKKKEIVIKGMGELLNKERSSRLGCVSLEKRQVGEGCNRDIVQPGVEKRWQR